MKAVGIILIVISCVLWAALFVVPFLPAPVFAKAGIVAFILVVAEILFWAGCFLAGAEWAKRAWEKFRKNRLITAGSRYKAGD